MAFWWRISQSKLWNLSNQLKRHCLRISDSPSFSSSCRGYVIDSQLWVIRRTTSNFGDSFRHFAAPAHAKSKNEEDTDGPRLNDQIKSEFVRLVSDNGHSIISTREALEQARKLKLDLVEVQRKANPPVCKIMDFHKEKYKKQTKEKDRAKMKSEVTLRKGEPKEVRFSGKTEEKDLRMKADSVKRLLERGYRVRCTARGSEDQDLGGLLARLSAMIEDIAVVESGPNVERGQAFVLVRHLKFGPAKKGGGKKSKVVAYTRSEVENASSGATVGSFMDDEDSGLASENEMLSEEADFSDGTPDYSETTAKQVNSKSNTASQHIPFNAPERLQSRPEVHYGKANSVPPTRQDSPADSHNRYKSSDSPNRSQAPNESSRYGRRMPATNTGFWQAETHGPRFRGTRPSPNDMPKQEKPPPFDPASGKSSFGIFSPSTAGAPGKPGRAAEAHAGERNSSYGSASSKPENNVNKRGQTGWGVFNRGSSNVNPN